MKYEGTYKNFFLFIVVALWSIIDSIYNMVVDMMMIIKDLATCGKKYQVIYADPPWRYEHLPIGSKGRAIERHYPTMSVEDIKKLPIKSLGKENSALFLWSTSPKLRESLEVMLSWGYVYRTCVIWDKEIIGMGYWFRNQHEILLIGLRGKFSPPAPQMRERSVYRERRTKHSVKPNYFRNWLSKCFSTSSKIELFARQQVEGWDCWGNEV